VGLQVLFEEMLTSLLKVTRIVSAPTGNALLIGASGAPLIADARCCSTARVVLSPRPECSSSASVCFVVAPIDRSLLAVATGKRTVTQLAAMVLEYALIAPKLTGSYSTADFLEEMKGVFRTVVLKKRQVMLSS
jgi:hypothetical protein